MVEKKKFEFDLSGIKTKEEFHDRIQKIISCPDYYGGNLDALYDILTEKGEDWELFIYHYEDFAQEMPDYGAAFKKMCEDAKAECPGLQISFVRQ